LVFAKNRNKDNSAVLYNCRLPPSMDLTHELGHIVKLWVMVNIEDGELLWRKSTLVQKMNQLPVRPLRASAPFGHQKNDAMLNGLDVVGTHYR